MNILEECSGDVWNAAEGATGKDASIVVDMKCPMKLQEVQFVNEVGDFGSRQFSVFGSSSSTGPWKSIYSGAAKEGREQVSFK